MITLTEIEKTRFIKYLLEKKEKQIQKLNEDGYYLLNGHELLAPEDTIETLIEQSYNFVLSDLTYDNKTKLN